MENKNTTTITLSELFGGSWLVKTAHKGLCIQLRKVKGVEIVDEKQEENTITAGKYALPLSQITPGVEFNISSIEKDFIALLQGMVLDRQGVQYGK
jgi:hypothetical protein